MFVNFIVVSLQRVTGKQKVLYVHYWVVALVAKIFGEELLVFSCSRTLLYLYYYIYIYRVYLIKEEIFCYP